MELRENTNEYWPEKCIKLFDKYKNCYNLIGNSGDKIDFKKTKIYDIMEGNINVGKIWTTHSDYLACPEILILVYPEYQKNEIATKTLNLYLDSFYHDADYLGAVVQNSNPLKEKIKKMLLNNGFKEFENDGEMMSFFYPEIPFFIQKDFSAYK